MTHDPRTTTDPDRSAQLGPTAADRWRAGRRLDAGRCTEREITEPVDLCLPDGRLDLAATGWSRRPLHRANLAPSARNKTWDYWCVLGSGFALSVTYSDVSYVGIVAAFVLDLATGDSAQREVTVPLARGIALPERVGGADLQWVGRGLRLDLTQVAGGTRIQVAFRSKRGEPVEADVHVALPAGHETLSVVVPWSDTTFQYTSKHTARPATGWLRWGDRTVALGEDGDAWGVLDAGRGRWPYRTAWNWGAASGRTDGRVVGLQLGGRWTDGTGATENALCIDGRLHKLSESLVWEYSRADWMAPWVITSPLSDRVELRFEPRRERRSRLELGVAGTEVHQCFGRYHGRVVDDAGLTVAVEGLLGWAEEARMRW